MNIFSEAHIYPLDISGKTLRNLSEDEVNRLVLFLDVDDTLGNCIGTQVSLIEPEIFEREYQSAVLNVRPLSKLIFETEFLAREPHLKYWSKNIYEFKFKDYIINLFDFLKKKNIKNICLFSAANKGYVDCIEKILREFFEVDIITSISVHEEPRMSLYRKLGENCFVEEIYIAKDMYKALQMINREDHIPLLIDDRPLWGANGFVIPINPFMNTIYEYIDKPIEKTNGVLIESRRE
jgi:hypothetical protein